MLYIFSLPHGGSSVPCTRVRVPKWCHHTCAKVPQAVAAPVYVSLHLHNSSSATTASAACVAKLDNDVPPVQLETCCLVTEYFVCMPPGISVNTVIHDTRNMNAFFALMAFNTTLCHTLTKSYEFCCWSKVTDEQVIKLVPVRVLKMVLSQVNVQQFQTIKS